VIGTQGLLVDGQTALVYGSRLIVATLKSVHPRKLVERRDQIPVVETELTFGSCQSALRYRDCVGVMSLLNELVDLLDEETDIIGGLREGWHSGKRQGTEQSHEGQLSPNFS
jgi:hypothetical protein